MPQDLDVTPDREFAHVGPGVETGSDHAVATDTGTTEFRSKAMQMRDDSCGKQIARSLAGDKHTVPGGCISG